MKKLLILAGVSMLMAGCVTTKDWAATGGSRSDGVVRLSYDYGSLQQVRVSEEQAVDLASKRCASWGYQGAEAFGGSNRQCIQPGGFGGCTAWQVNKEYQCIGKILAD